MKMLLRSFYWFQTFCVHFKEMLGFKENRVYVLIENTFLAHFNFQCSHLNMLGLKTSLFK